MSKIFSKKNLLFTNRYLSLARLVLIQLLLMLRPSWNKVEIKLYQRCFNVAHRRCINVVQRWKSDVEFCFIFNVGSTFFQRWSTTLKQRWSDVEMLAGHFLSDWTFFFNDLFIFNIFYLWFDYLLKFVFFLCTANMLQYQLTAFFSIKYPLLSLSWLGWENLRLEILLQDFSLLINMIMLLMRVTRRTSLRLEKGTGTFKVNKEQL